MRRGCGANDTPHGKHHVSYQQHITHVIERKDAEDDIVDGTDGSEPGQIEYGLGGGQMVTHIVDGSQCDDDDGPHGTDEDAQMEWQGKGVERGMVVEMAPRLGPKHLDGSIEGGRHGDKDAKCRRIVGVDVVEVDYRCLATHEPPHGIGAAHYNAEGQEDEQVSVGEDVDELRDGIVGRDAFQQLALANPALCDLIAGYLDPNGVDGIGGNYLYFGNDDALAPNDIHGVEDHVGQIVGERQAGGGHDEVVILSVVMGGGKGDGVELMLGEVPSIGSALAVIVATGQRCDEGTAK